jgi:hypothetical protein
VALVSETLPTDAVDDTDPTYRRLSPLAVLSAVAGLASATALVAPLLRIVPVAGVVLAIMALRGIAQRSESLTGRGLALVGLALSLIFGVGAIVKDSVEQRLHRAAAAEVAEKFLTLLAEDKLAEAFELTLDFSQRRSAEGVADYYAANPTAGDRLKEFAAERLVTEVTPLDKPKVELVDPGMAQLNVSRVAIAPVYLLTAGDRKLYAIVQLDRAPARLGQPAAWRVASYAPTNPPAGASSP